MKLFPNPYANAVQCRVKPQPVPQLPPFFPLSFIYLLQQLKPNSFLMKPKFLKLSTWEKMDNIKRHREYCFAQRNNSNLQNRTPEDSSNGFTIHFKSKPQIPVSI